VNCLDDPGASGRLPVTFERAGRDENLNPAIRHDERPVGFEFQERGREKYAVVFDLANERLRHSVLDRERLTI
jgi:hypothetical protein